jgi:hypothetical protein
MTIRTATRPRPMRSNMAAASPASTYRA